VIQKIVGILLSTLVCGGVTFLLLSSVAELDQPGLDAAHGDLDAGADTAVGVLAESGADLPAAAADLARAGFDADFRVLAATKAAVKPGGQPNAFQLNRIATFSQKITDLLGEARAKKPHVSGVALVDDKLNVLAGDSELFIVGTRLDDVGHDIAWLQATLAGGSARSTLQKEGELWYLAAAPLYKGAKVAGAIVVESKLAAMPAGLATGTVLLVDGKVKFGEPPAGFAPSESDEPSLVQPAQIATSFMGIEMPFSGVMLETGATGTWAKRFQAPDGGAVTGYVFADTASHTGRLANLQLAIIVLGFLTWFVHALLLLGLSGRARVGVAASASASSSADGEEPAPSPLASAPSVDQVLAAAGPAAAPPSVHDEKTTEVMTKEMGDLQFEAIKDSGTLDLGAKKAPPPPPSDDEGYVARVLDDEIAVPPTRDGDESDADATNVMESPFPSEAPDDGADDEADDEADADAADVEEEEDADDEGDAPLPPVAPPPDPGATSVLQITPALLAQMRESSEPASPPAPPSPPPPVKLEAEITPAEEPAEEPADEPVEPSGSKAFDMPAAAEPPPPPAPPKAPEPPPPPKTSSEPLQLQPTAVMQMSPELLSQLREAAAESPSKPVLPAPEPPKGKPDEAVFREVFDKFVSTRKSCGEAGELSYAKFVQRLEESRAAVIDKHHCKDVRFEVYVKNGKAALKATPV
jgi:hypothetical protein